MSLLVQDDQPPEVLMQDGQPPAVLMQDGQPPEVLMQDGQPPEVLIQDGQAPAVLLQDGQPPALLLQDDQPTENFYHQIVDYESWYRSFIFFDDFSFQPENQSYSVFLADWQDRYKVAKTAGFSYNEPMLAFKLLKNSHVGAEVQTTIFAALQSRADLKSEDLLLQTMACLNKIMNPTKDQDPSNSDKIFKIEKQEDSEDFMKITDYLDYDECSDEVNDIVENFDDEEMEKIQPVKKRNKSLLDGAKLKKRKKIKKEILLLSRNLEERKPCNFCHMKLKDDAMTIHLLTQHNQNPKCYLCDQLFDDYIDLETHRKQSHSNVKIMCSVCNLTIKGSFARHLSSKLHNLKPTCDFCEQCFVSNHHLVKHMQKSHTEESKLVLRTCDLCCKVFIDDQGLRGHMRECHNFKKKYSCHKCQLYQTNHLADLERHIKAHERKEEKALEPNQCDQCGKDFATKRKLQAHMRMHAPFQCSSCKTRHASQEGLDSHIKNHKFFPCDRCDKVFTMSKFLRIHMQTSSHKAERTFGCEVCGQMFYASSTLSTHKRIHGEKVHVCPLEECGKRFSLKTGLNRHLLIHSGEKNFSCTLCGKCFSAKCQLKDHMDRHNGVKKHICDVCEKGFLHKDKLNVHKRIHTGERPYKCDNCEKAFVQCKDLKKHLLSHLR